MAQSLPVRTYMVTTAVLIFFSGAVGARFGYAVGGISGMAVGTLALGVGAVIGSLVVVRRKIAAFRARTEAVAEVEAQGYAEGMSQAVLGLVSAYHHAVFPLSGPGGVLPEERIARRINAYHLAAAEELPEPVRRAAADALATLDSGDDHQHAVEALKQLSMTVYAQRRKLR